MNGKTTRRGTLVNKQESFYSLKGIEV